MENLLVEDAVFCLKQNFGKRKITSKEIKVCLSNPIFDCYYCTFTLSIVNQVYHYDGFIELKTPQLTANLSQSLLGATFEPKIGTNKENINYCMLENEKGSCKPAKENGRTIDSVHNGGPTRRVAGAYEKCKGIKDPEHYERKFAEYTAEED